MWRKMCKEEQHAMEPAQFKKQANKKVNEKSKKMGDDLSEEDKAEEDKAEEDEAADDEAEEDKAEEDEAEEDEVEEDEAEEDEAEEATVEVAKAISECGGKYVKKNSHSIKSEQSKNPAKKKNNEQSNKVGGGDLLEEDEAEEVIETTQRKHQWRFWQSTDMELNVKEEQQSN